MSLRQSMAALCVSGSVFLSATFATADEQLFNQSPAGNAAVGDIGFALAQDGNGSRDSARDCACCLDACSCDSCGCDDCCKPRWIVRGGAVILQRSTPSNLSMIDDVATGVELLNANSFNFEWRAGPDITLMRQLNPDDYLELRHFNVADFNAFVSFTTADPFEFRTGDTVLLFSPIGGEIGSSYFSNLYSTEINFRRQLSPWATWLLKEETENV